MNADSDPDVAESAATFDATVYYEPGEYPERPLRFEVTLPDAVAAAEGGVDQLTETVRFDLTTDDTDTDDAAPAYPDPFPDTYHSGDYDDDAALLEDLEFTEDEEVLQNVAFPSAVWATIARATGGDDDTVADWIRRQAWVASYKRQEMRRKTPTVDLSPGEWEEIAVRAAAFHQLGTDPDKAFADARNELVDVRPTLVVDGEPKGVGDVPGVDDGEGGGAP